MLKELRFGLQEMLTGLFVRLSALDAVIVGSALLISIFVLIEIFL